MSGTITHAEALEMAADFYERHMGPPLNKNGYISDKYIPPTMQDKLKAIRRLADDILFSDRNPAGTFVPPAQLGGFINVLDRAMDHLQNQHYTECLQELQHERSALHRIWTGS